jgi:hypothetical protein
MNHHRHVPIEEMDFFRSYVEVCDWAWRVVNGWPRLAQDTVGKQLIRAADRVRATRLKAMDGIRMRTPPISSPLPAPPLARLASGSSVRQLGSYYPPLKVTRTSPSWCRQPDN